MISKNLVVIACPFASLDIEVFWFVYKRSDI